jgi:hypothetical protein
LRDDLKVDTHNGTPVMAAMRRAGPPHSLHRGPFCLNRV